MAAAMGIGNDKSTVNQNTLPAARHPRDGCAAGCALALAALLPALSAHSKLGHRRWPGCREARMQAALPPAHARVCPCSLDGTSGPLCCTRPLPPTQAALQTQTAARQGGELPCCAEAARHRGNRAALQPEGSRPDAPAGLHSRQDSGDAQSTRGCQPVQRGRAGPCRPALSDSADFSTRRARPPAGFSERILAISVPGGLAFRAVLS